MWYGKLISCGVTTHTGYRNITSTPKLTSPLRGPECDFVGDGGSVDFRFRNLLESCTPEGCRRSHFHTIRKQIKALKRHFILIGPRSSREAEGKIKYIQRNYSSQDNAPWAGHLSTWVTHHHPIDTTTNSPTTPPTTVRTVP